MTEEEKREYKHRQSAAKRKFNQKAYDRVFVCVPKGVQELLKNHAKEQGESLNGMVNILLLAEMGWAEWPYRYDKWEQAVLPIDQIPKPEE